MDPNLRSFAVFINSNASLYKSTSKARANIPFNGNLAQQDPHKLLRVALSQMKFTNSVYNIDETNNTLKICAQFDTGRGYDNSGIYGPVYGTEQQLNQRLWQTWTVRIPPGYYDTQTLSTILSEPGVLYPEERSPYVNRVGYQSVKQQFVYQNGLEFIYTFQDCFIGFGANPADPADPIKTNGVITIDQNSKCVFQSPDLAHLVQYQTDIHTPVINTLLPTDTGLTGKTSTSLDYSMVYRGIHLLFDGETRALLETLGFFNIDTVPAPVIPGYCNNLGVQTEARGYSIYLTARELKDPSTTNPWDNIVYYTFDFLEARDKLVVAPPSYLQTPVVIAGHVYGTTLGELSPVLSIRDQDNDDSTGYREFVPGEFVAGTGITQPNPFITSYTTSEETNPTFQVNFIAPNPALPVTSDELYVPQATWIAEGGYGLLIGYPVRIKSYLLAKNAAVFVNPIVGYYVADIDDTVDPVVITLNNTYTLQPSAVPLTNIEMVWRNYILNRSQAVQTTGVGTNYVAMVVTGDPIPTAAAELRPNVLTNLEGLDEIYVHCPQLRTVHFSSTNRAKLAPSDVICVIPVDVVFGSKQTFQPPTILDAFLNNTNVTNLEIVLTDSNDQEIDFNGVDWSMVLKCEEVDVDTTQALNQQGLLNTPFQDQLQLLEGTGRQELKAKRGRLPYEFYESSKNRKY